MMKIKGVAFALVLSGLMVPSSFAEEPLNLVGTWKGISSAVYVGNPNHFSNRTSGVTWGEDTEFTWTFSEQRGNDFAGEITTKDRSEKFIGSISPNNKDIIYVDEDGSANMSIRDPNTIDLCYSHITEASRLSSCWTLKRVK